MSIPRQTQIMESSMGQEGAKYISTTAETTASDGYVFTAIQALSESVVTLVGNVESFTSVTVQSGDIIYGRYTSCTLDSGDVMAYQGV